MIYQLLITALMFTSLEGQTKSVKSSMEPPTTSIYKTSCNETTKSSTESNVCYFDLCHNVNTFFPKSITVFCEITDIYYLITTHGYYLTNDCVSCSYILCFYYYMHICLLFPIIHSSTNLYCYCMEDNLNSKT